MTKLGYVVFLSAMPFRRQLRQGDQNKHICFSSLCMGSNILLILNTNLEISSIKTNEYKLQSDRIYIFSKKVNNYNYRNNCTVFF